MMEGNYLLLSWVVLFDSRHLIKKEWEYNPYLSISGIDNNSADDTSCDLQQQSIKTNNKTN